MRGRTHSRQFGLDIVRWIACGDLTQARACREHQLAHSAVERRVRQYHEHDESSFETAANAQPVIEARIAELEQHCGRLSVGNAALEWALAVSASRTATR